MAQEGTGADIARTQERTERLIAAMDAMMADIQAGSKRIKAFMDENGYGEGRVEKLLDMIGPAARPAMEKANARYMRECMAATHAFERAVAESLEIAHKRKKPKAQKLKV